MSLENPTRLRIGMHANFGGKDYRLIGRVVMGVTDDGESYYWNEFNLEGGDGSYADLVYEETERGGEWRLFTLFDPEYPMTAADAATKRVGDRLNLTGTDVRVTLLDTSRVYRIEGKAPEGVEVGDVANYFNAEAGEIMQVVSWTGDEIEFYNGVNLSPGVVNSAFKLPQDLGGLSGLGKSFSSLGGSGSGNYKGGIKFAVQAVCVIFIFWLIFAQNMSCSPDYESSSVKHVAADTPPLAVGATGKWHDKNWHITAHALVEIAQVGATFDRHEYELTDENGMKALLVCGDRPAADDWTMFEQIFPLLPPPTGKQMAAKNVGDTVDLDGFTGKVTDLFRSTIERAEADGLSGLKNGTVWYGLAGTNEFNTLLARWNGEGISFYRGQATTAKKVAASFNSQK